MPERLRVLRARLASALAAALRRFFGAQAARVVARFLAGQTDLLPPEEAVMLGRLVDRGVLAVVLESSVLAASAAGTEPLAEGDAALLDILAQSATRVRGITETTRQAIRRTLQEAALRGDGQYAAARALRAVVQETYPGRADTIARTEMALASQAAAHDRYRAAGVTRVRIRDGAGCGWTRHNDPDKADGSIRYLWEVVEHPVAHPNCRRVSVPIRQRAGA